MARTLPYRAQTPTGESYDIRFPLHPETASPMRVAQMLTELLATLDREVALDGRTSNGDVLQALAMAFAIRAEIIAAPKPTTDRLASDLLQTALAALGEADRETGPVGHA